MGRTPQDAERVNGRNYNIQNRERWGIPEVLKSQLDSKISISAKLANRSCTPSCISAHNNTCMAFSDIYSISVCMIESREPVICTKGEQSGTLRDACLGPKAS